MSESPFELAKTSDLPGMNCADLGQCVLDRPESRQLTDRAQKYSQLRQYDEAEKLYRRNLNYRTAKYKAEPTECELQALNQSRQRLAGVLLSQDKFSEAEKLLHQAFSDVENRRYGQLSNEEAHTILSQWVNLEDENAKYAQVDKAFERSERKVRSEIKAYGTNPTDWLVSAMKKNRVLAIGDDHRGDEMHLELGKQLMQGLKAAGATHLAVELPSNHQVILDRFAQTGNIDLALLEDSRGTNEYLTSSGFLERENMRDLMKSAVDAGLKLVAVDDADSINVGVYNAIFGTGRDRAMAAHIAHILDESPKNKVVYWAGSMHAQVSVDQRDHDRASQLLRFQDFKVSSVLPKEKNEGDSNPFYKIADEVKVPTLVPMSKAKSLGKLPELKSIYPGVQNFDAWDAVIIYPQK